MTLSTSPLSERIGAIVEGIDTRLPLSPAERSRFAEALAEHQVVFIRDQHVTSEQFAAFAQQFGPLGSHPVDQVLGRQRSLSRIVDDAEHLPAGFDWHTDLSWTPEPPKWGLLRAIEIPPSGGDTLWVSGRAMLQALSADERRRLSSLGAIHSPDRALLDSIERHHGDRVRAQIEAAYPPTVHPLVRAHETGHDDALWMCPLSNIAGGGDNLASAADLARLYELIESTDAVVRWQWREGDVAVWDETCTVHRALTDHAPQRRVMERCTLAGTAPRKWGLRTSK